MIKVGDAVTLQHGGQKMIQMLNSQTELPVLNAAKNFWTFSVG